MSSDDLDHHAPRSPGPDRHDPTTLRGDTLAEYNGAGIVPGSVPAEEWAEIETKMRNFLRVLRHDGQEHGA